MAETSPVQVAPGELEFVRRFVNTLDVEKGEDRLQDAAGWREWAGSEGMSGAASAADLAHARALREALRAGLLANHAGSAVPDETVAALNTAADRSRMTVRFDPHGATLRGADSGVDAAFARIVAAVADSMNDATWPRLKVCVNDECRWAFYDRSRSRTAQWCSMSICGNRAKQSRWRAAREASASNG